MQLYFSVEQKLGLKKELKKPNLYLGGRVGQNY